MIVFQEKYMIFLTQKKRPLGRFVFKQFFYLLAQLANACATMDVSD